MPGQWFLPTEQDLMIMLRLTLAFVLGGLVGWERERMNQAAGLRTHMLVAAGAAAFTVASVYGFDDLGTVRDPARLAAQIVTGIGFIGAGVIFQGRRQIRGLTTAASIWIVAAIGVMAGLGMIWVGLYTAVATWIALRWLKRLAPPRARRLDPRSGPGPVTEPIEEQG